LITLLIYLLTLALDELVKETGRGDAKCKTEGLRKQMSKMKTYVGVVVCQALFGPCEELAKALQAVNTTATGAIRASNVLLTHLRKLRDEDEFDHLYSQVKIDAAQLGLKVPLASESDQSRRQVRAPSRYEMQTNTSRPHVFTEEKLRSEYYAPLDLLISEVERRFDQPGLSRMTTLENMLSSDEISEDAHEVLAIYDDVDANKFILERRMLPNLYAASHSQSRNAERAQDAIAPQCMPKMCMSGQITLQPNRQQSVSSSVKR
jgi:hypothetical protein